MLKFVVTSMLVLQTAAIAHSYIDGNKTKQLVEVVEPESVEVLPNVCKANIDGGRCLASFVRYAFDAQLGECRQFVYGGCRGNGNNFATKADCERACTTKKSAVKKADSQSRNETGAIGEWQQTSSENNGATCYDRKIAAFIDTALGYYSHDMGALSKYILDQIIRARYSGSWLIHAEMVGSQRQGLEWQSATNGDLFAANSRHGCYYHDTQTYIIIVRY